VDDIKQDIDKGAGAPKGVWGLGTSSDGAEVQQLLPIDQQARVGQAALRNLAQFCPYEFA
jgi:hypothetical protein